MKITLASVVSVLNNFGHVMNYTCPINWI